MRVGILTQYYPPEMGAAQARLSELADRLVERGHGVSVLTAMPSYPHGRVFDGYGGLVRRERRGDVDVLRAWAWPSASTRALPRMLSYLSFVVSAAIVGIVRSPRVDVLITESPPLPLGLTGYLLSRAKRARWVFNVSDLWPESAVRLGLLRERSLVTRLARMLERFCYRRAWVVSGQSREILESIGDRFPGVRTVPLLGAVDTERFAPEHGNPDLLREVAGPAPFVAVYAGLHGVAQGLDLLLDAASLLESRADVALVLLGDGPVKRRLVESAGRRGLANVRFVDTQPREAMPALLAAADVAIVPLGDRLPGAVPSKLYEAMSSAVPVVLVADGEPAEIVESAGAGIVVPHGDAAGLAAAVERLAADPELRARMGSAGRRAATESHDRREACDRFIDALEELL